MQSYLLFQFAILSRAKNSVCLYKCQKKHLSSIYYRLFALHPCVYKEILFGEEVKSLF